MGFSRLMQQQSCHASSHQRHDGTQTHVQRLRIRCVKRSPSCPATYTAPTMQSICSTSHGSTIHVFFPRWQCVFYTQTSYQQPLNPLHLSNRLPRNKLEHPWTTGRGEPNPHMLHIQHCPDIKNLIHSIPASSYLRSRLPSSLPLRSRTYAMVT